MWNASQRYGEWRSKCINAPFSEKYSLSGTILATFDDLDMVLRLGEWRRTVTVPLGDKLRFGQWVDIPS